MKESKQDRDVRALRAAGLSLASANRLASTGRGSSLALIATGSAFVVGMTLLGVYTMNLPQSSASPEVQASAQEATVEEPIVTVSAPEPAATPPVPVAMVEEDITPADPAPVAEPAEELPWVTALRDGAPLPAPEVQTDCVSTLAVSLADVMLNFGPGSADVNPEDFDTLLSVGTMANACPDARVLVAGHSDSSGSDVLNLQLSWDRAEATVDALRQMGIDTLQFETVGFGARAPLTQGSSTDEDINRRVEMRVIREGGQP